MIVIFTEFGEAHCREARRIERSMVSATKIAVAPEFEQRLNGCPIAARSLSDVSRQFARNGIVLAAESANHAKLRLGGAIRNTFGKNTHNFRVLPGTLVPSDYVVIDHGLDLPALRLGKLRYMFAAV